MDSVSRCYVAMSTSLPFFCFTSNANDFTSNANDFICIYTLYYYNLIKDGFQRIHWITSLFQARTVAKPDIKIKEPPKVPLWVIILAACGGLLILIVIIILLWKVSILMLQISCLLLQCILPQELNFQLQQRMKYSVNVLCIFG